MAMNLRAYDHDDDDYIDMEVSSYSNLFCHSMSSPPFSKEFEFQMSTASLEKEATTSPADELFYKGKLLPLHLPPRLQMVKKLLENSNSSESCCVSRELNPEEYFFEYSAQISGFIDENHKKSWAKKLKLMKQSSIGSKFRASRAYIKSLFGKSGGSDDSCTVATKVADEGTVSKSRVSSNKCAKPSKKMPFGQIQRDKYQTPTTAAQNKQQATEDGSNRLHRRSFSMAIKRYSTNKYLSSLSSSGSSSSSSSTSSNGSQKLPFLTRSSSAKSEIDNPIQGAIAHCKQSQQLFHSRKTANEVKRYSLSASRITICEEQERPDLCRG